MIILNLSLFISWITISHFSWVFQTCIKYLFSFSMTKIFLLIKYPNTNRPKLLSRFFCKIRTNFLGLIWRPPSPSELTHLGSKDSNYEEFLEYKLMFTSRMFHLTFRILLIFYWSILCVPRWILIYCCKKLSLYELCTILLL